MRSRSLEQPTGGPPALRLASWMAAPSFHPSLESTATRFCFVYWDSQGQMQFSMAVYLCSWIPNIIASPLFGFLAPFASQLPVHCVLCVQAASEPFWERGRDPEGEFRMLANVPALLGGIHQKPSWSLRGGATPWDGQLPRTAQSGLTQTARPFMGPPPALRSKAASCCPLKPAF